MHASSSTLPIPLFSFAGRGRGQPSFLVLASKRDAYDSEYGGRLVDENMVVLRRRIQEMKMEERNYEAPAEWTEWEKRYHARYGADVSELVGFFQGLLMNTRPSLGIGIMGLAMLSVPASMAIMLFHLVEAVKSVLG